MPVQTPLAGESLERAKHVLGLSTRLGDGSSLLNPENLERLGFSTMVVDASPVDEGGAGVETAGSPGSVVTTILRTTCLLCHMLYTCILSAMLVLVLLYIPVFICAFFLTIFLYLLSL